MMIKNILTIFKKEIGSYLDNPASYISIIIFVGLWEFMFFRSAFLVGESSLRGLFEYLPWLMIFFASAVTMGTVASEKSEGTLEILLTHPVRETELILGKLLSSSFYMFVALLFSLPIAIAFSLYGFFDWGSYVGQFLAALLLSVSVGSLGIFVSGLFMSQIAALITASAVSFVLYIAGTEFVTRSLPLFLVPVFERLSFLSHVASMSRGVIDTRDIWYFISFIIIFLLLSYLTFIKNKFGNRSDYYRPIYTGTILFIGIAILTNIVGSRIPGRIDLTKNRIYSLSPATKNVLLNLNDIVTITFYSSTRLPSQLVPVVRDVKDVLKDYNQISKGNIVVINKDPSDNPTVSSEASQRGVREVQFNVIGSEEFQMKTGFLGLVVSYQDRHEVIPFIENTGDLEYQLTSIIAKLTTVSKKTVVFLTGHGEKNLFTDMSVLKTELEKQYKVLSTSIDDSNKEISSESAVLVVAGPNIKMDTDSVNAVNNYLKSGKNVLFLVDNYNISPQTLNATLNENSMADFVSGFGVKVNNDILYDLRSSETVRMGQGAFGFYLPYPYWLRALAVDKQSQVTAKIDGVLLPWASSITLDEEMIKQKGYTAVKLYETSEFAGSSKGSVDLTPDKAVFSNENITRYLLSVALTGKKDTEFSGRIIVVGDSDFITDQFTNNSSQNTAFALSAISWLASDEALADIKIKQSILNRLVFNSPFDAVFIKWGNIFIVFLIPLGTGIYRLLKRKNLKTKKYIKK